MGNSDNKSNFIKQLFLYYKPILVKEKQIQLLLDWLSSCLEKEEYEMANTLKALLYNVENDIDMGTDNNLSVIKVPDNIELVYDEDFIGGELPKIVTKDVENLKIEETPQIETPKRGWRFINLWNKPSGFTLIDCSFSLKKKEFTLIIINYGIKFG